VKKISGVHYLIWHPKRNHPDEGGQDPWLDQWHGFSALTITGHRGGYVSAAPRSGGSYIRFLVFTAAECGMYKQWVWIRGDFIAKLLEEYDYL
jgi:hypothetical protein